MFIVKTTKSFKCFLSSSIILFDIIWYDTLRYDNVRYDWMWYEIISYNDMIGMLIYVCFPNLEFQFRWCCSPCKSDNCRIYGVPAKSHVQFPLTSVLPSTSLGSPFSHEGVLRPSPTHGTPWNSNCGDGKTNSTGMDWPVGHTCASTLDPSTYYS